MAFEIRLVLDENELLFSVGLEDRARIIEALNRISEQEKPEGDCITPGSWMLRLSGWVVIYDWDEPARILRVRQLRPEAKG